MDFDCLFGEELDIKVSGAGRSSDPERAALVAKLDGMEVGQKYPFQVPEYDPTDEKEKAKAMRYAAGLVASVQKPYTSGTGEFKEVNGKMVEIKVCSRNYSAPRVDDATRDKINAALAERARKAGKPFTPFTREVYVINRIK